MIAWIFKIRKVKLTKKGEKDRDGWNIALVTCGDSRFHLETFIQSDVFPENTRKGMTQNFKPGFFEVDIDEFQQMVEGNLCYRKKIISIMKTVENAKVLQCLDLVSDI